MNKIVILGNLTRDPEMGSTPDGIQFANFTVAVNRWSNGKELTDFMRVTVWRQRAEACGKYIKKGSKVCVWGKATAHPWTASDGTPRASIEITADEIEFVSIGRASAEADAAETAVNPPVPPVPPVPQPVEDPDDLPF